MIYPIVKPDFIRYLTSYKKAAVGRNYSLDRNPLAIYLQRLYGHPLAYKRGWLVGPQHYHRIGSQIVHTLPEWGIHFISDLVVPASFYGILTGEQCLAILRIHE